MKFSNRQSRFMFTVKGIEMQRRSLLKVVFIGGAASAIGGCTLPPLVRDSASGNVSVFSTLNWQIDAFRSKTVEEAIKNLHGAVSPMHSEKIKLDVPIFAESSAMVPVTVSTTLPGTTAIHLMVLNNPAPFWPLSMSFDILPGALPHVATRLWLPKSSDVVAYVQAHGKIYFTRVDVQLQSIDGCVTHKLGS